MLVVLSGVIVSSVLCLIRAQSYDCGISVTPLVVGGRPVTQGEYPWLVALYQIEEGGKWTQFCGGALLSRRVVLTAAHCLTFEGTVKKPEDIRVGLGKLYRDFYYNEDYAIIANVREVVVHERFLGYLSGYSFDVALLKLNIVVELPDNIAPVCIDLELHTTTTVSNGAKVHAAGWGTTENGTSSVRALAGDVTYLDHSTCLIRSLERNRKFITLEKICASSLNGSQVDKGDSGGPLTFLKKDRHFVIGVVSTKIRDENAFSTFTDLLNHEILFWLIKKMAVLDLPDCGTSAAPVNTGGGPISKGRYPWLAVLYEEDGEGRWTESCDGTLLSPRIVVTAGHCLVGMEKVIEPEKIRVGLGNVYQGFNHIEENYIIVKVREVIVNERYVGDLSAKASNIGLLVLNTTVQMSDHILPACIDLDMKTTVSNGSTVHIPVWYSAGNGTSADRALAADLSYLGYASCLSKLLPSNWVYVTHDKFCALKADGFELYYPYGGRALTYLKNGRHFAIGLLSDIVSAQDVFVFMDLSAPEIRSWLKKKLENMRIPGYYEGYLLSEDKSTRNSYKSPFGNSNSSVVTPMQTDRKNTDCGTTVVPLGNGRGYIAQGQYPWLATIYKREAGNWSHDCTGALITPRLVLTGAYSLVSDTDKRITVPGDFRVGLSKLYGNFYHNEDYAVFANVSEIIVPERYVNDFGNLAFDVGLLKLSSPVELSDYIRPVCIDLDTTTTVSNGATVHAAHWGYTAIKIRSTRAVTEDYSYLEYYACLKQALKSEYRSRITHDKFCGESIYGYREEIKDSGGAVTISKDGRQFLVGVLNYNLFDQEAIMLITNVSAPEIRIWLKEQLLKLN